MMRPRQSATPANKTPLAQPGHQPRPDEQPGQAREAAEIAHASGSPLPQEARPQPRFRPSRRALLTAGGVTVGGVALGMGKEAPADAATNYVVQGAQLISVNDALYGAKGDSTTDDTSAIQAALNATPSGGTCLIPRPPGFAFNAAESSTGACQFTATNGPTWTAGTPVVLAGASLPGGFTAGVTYYIVSPLSNTFELATTPTGNAIGYQSAGLGGTVGTFYLVGSAPIEIPDGVSVLGPVVSRPGKSRSAVPPLFPTIRVKNSANLNAIFTDSVFTGSGSTPVLASAGIQIRGLVIDGNAANQTGGLGHGIALMTEASSIEECSIQNTYGSGIVFADQNVHGGQTGTNVSQVENGIYFCNVYLPGTSGIVVQNNTGNLTDGYIMYNIVDFDFGTVAAAPGVPATNTPVSNTTGCEISVLISGGTLSNVQIGPSGALVSVGTTDGTYSLPAGQEIELTYTTAPTWTWTGYGIQNLNMADWQVVGNHLYALPGNGYQLYVCNGCTIAWNRLDNYGGTGAASTTSVGYDIQVTPYGRTSVFGNRSLVDETNGAGKGNFVYYQITPGSTGQTNDLYFSDNAIRQKKGTGGTSSLGYSFAAGTSGTLNVSGVNGPFILEASTTGTATSPYPDIVSGAVTFLGYDGQVQQFQQSTAPAANGATSLVMAGFAIELKPQVTGKYWVFAAGNSSTSTVVANTLVAAYYNTPYSSAPAQGVAVPSGSTLVGLEQTVHTPAVNLNASWTIIGTITGMTPGTTYWLDLAYATSASGDDASISNVQIMYQEVA
jgi:hypothetical protein